MAYPKKVSDEVILEAYARLGNVWMVGEEVGICGQSVHERLQKLGKNKTVNVFSEADIELLAREYKKYADAGKLDELASKMNRTKQFICRQAGKLGLTDQCRKRPYIVKDNADIYLRQHKKVRDYRGSPKHCEVCETNSPHKWYEWANLTGDYDNPSDYKRMCRKCHRRYDKGRGEPSRAHLKRAANGNHNQAMEG